MMATIVAHQHAATEELVLTFTKDTFAFALKGITEAVVSKVSIKDLAMHYANYHITSSFIFYWLKLAQCILTLFYKFEF